VAVAVAVAVATAGVTRPRVGAAASAEVVMVAVRDASEAVVAGTTEAVRDAKATSLGLVVAPRPAAWLPSEAPTVLLG